MFTIVTYPRFANASENSRYAILTILMHRQSLCCTASDIQLGYHESERDPEYFFQVTLCSTSRKFVFFLFPIHYNRNNNRQNGAIMSIRHYYTIIMRMRFKLNQNQSITWLIWFRYLPDIWSRSFFLWKFSSFQIWFFDIAIASERLIFPKNRNQRTCEKRSMKSMQATIVSTLKGSEREIRAAVEALSTV